MGRLARGVSSQQAPNALDKSRVSQIKRIVLGYVDGERLEKENKWRACIKA